MQSYFYNSHKEVNYSESQKYMVRQYFEVKKEAIIMKKNNQYVEFNTIKKYKAEINK